MSYSSCVGNQLANQGIAAVQIPIGQDIPNIKSAKDAKAIYEIVSKAFDQERFQAGYFYNFWSQCDPQEGSIRSLISQRLSTLDKGNKTLQRINVLLSYIRRVVPNCYSFYSSFPIEEKTRNSLSSWVKDANKSDLSEEEMNSLLNRDSSRHLNSIFTLPTPSNPFSGISDDLLNEFYSLSQSKSLRTPFTGFAIKTNKEESCPNALLHDAIQGRKSCIAKYLLKIGANSNSVDKKGRSAIMNALQAIIDSPPLETEKSFSIFSDLLAYRKPIQEIELFYLLDLCCHQYKANDPTFNLSLFDEGISLLLGCKQSINKFFENERKLFLKYLAHMHWINGIHNIKDTTGAQTAVNLEGLHRHDYIQLRLRLLLEAMIEQVRVSPAGNAEEFSIIYHEFLVELEMGWISQLLYSWRTGRISGDRTNTERFCKCLSEYAFKQIIHLQSGKEYPLHVGWPGHSICVVFRREESQLTIRIDNLGEGCESHSSRTENKRLNVQSKLLRQFTINDGAVSKDSFEPIKSYLSSLFFNVAFADPRETDQTKRNELVAGIISKVYYPPIPFHIQPICVTENSDPYYPAQTVGNCTFASFSLGVRKRLRDDLFDKVSGLESGVFGFIENRYTRFLQLLQQSPQPPSLKIESPESDHSFRLKNFFNTIYQELLPQEQFPYIMQPTLFGKEQNLAELISTLFRPTSTFSSVEKTPSRSPFRILVQGAAGLGKTVLSKQLSNELRQRESGLVIYLQLRNLSNERYPAERNKTYTLIDIIEKEYFKKPLNDVEKRLLNHELSRQETIWVIDGLDELHLLPQLKESIHELMGKERLIVTSRSGSHPELRLDIHEYLYLQNYSEKEMHQLIDVHFSDEASIESKEKIKKAIAENKQLRILCSVPITLTITCQAVSQHNEEILVKQNLAELYDCCILAHLREAYKRGGDLRTHNDSKVKGFYKTAVDFMKCLAYESLRDYRRVVSSQEIVENALNRQGIKQEDKHFLFEDLKAIGLIEISASGAEFVHATYQEYFAACFLVKSLTQSKKGALYQDAKAFIEKHASDSSYQSVFSFMIHQLLFLIAQEKREEIKKKLIKLIESCLSNFTRPPVADQAAVHRRSSAFLQGISLLNVYTKGIEAGIVTEQGFIDKYKDFIEGSFLDMLGKWSTEGSCKETPNSLIPSLNVSREIDFQLAALFLTIPALKTGLSVYSRLLENMKADSFFVLPLVWRTIFFTQSTKDFNWKTIHEVQKVASKIPDDQNRVTLLRGVLGLTLDRIEEIVLQQSLSNEDVTTLQSIKESLDYQLPSIPQTTATCSERGLLPTKLAFLLHELMVPTELVVTKKIIHCLDLLLRQKEPPSAIQELSGIIQRHLPLYVFTLFNSPNWTSHQYSEELATCCRQLISMQTLGLSLRSIFRADTVRPLAERVKGCLKTANQTDGRDSPPRSAYLAEVGFALEHFLPIVDFVSPVYGDEWFTGLYQLYSSGGICVSRPAKRNCEEEVTGAIMRFQPYVSCSVQGDRSVLFLRFQRICSQYGYGNVLFQYGSLEKRKNLLHWLETLKDDPSLSQHHHWISDACQTLTAGLELERSFPFVTAGCLRG